MNATDLELWDLAKFLMLWFWLAWGVGLCFGAWVRREGA